MDLSSLIIVDLQKKKPLNENVPSFSNVFSPVSPTKKQKLTLFGAKVAAGSPFPADDFVEGEIDLNDHLIQKPQTTFLVKVTGDSMIEAGIHENDLLIVDRSIEPHSGKIVIAVLNGELTVKRLHKLQGKVYLAPENPQYSLIEIKEEDDLSIWGVVTRVIHDI